MMDTDTTPAGSTADKAAAKTDTTALPEATAALAAPAATVIVPKTTATNAAEPRKVVRRRKKKEKEGPKHPLTGYIRFMNDRREELRAQQPDATTIEITKLIGAEWNVLSDERKQPYLSAAKLAFERYNQECIDYKKKLSEQAAGDSDADIVTPKKEPKAKQPKMTPTATSAAVSAAAAITAVEMKTEIHSPPPARPIPAPSPVVDHKAVSTAATANHNHTNVVATTVIATAPSHSTLPPPPAPITPKVEAPPPRTGNYDIPIFTDEFLDHNKLVDVELRTLRKSNTDYEQQNAVLERHVENMRTGVAKLQSDTADQQYANAALAAYLASLRAKLAGSALAQLTTPAHGGGATLANVDEYMAALLAMATTTPTAAAAGDGVLHKAREVLRKLDV